MNHTILSVLTASLLLAAPALADSESAQTKKEKVQPDGTKVNTETKKDWKADGSGEAKTEVKTENPNTGEKTRKATKVKRSKDGKVETKTEAATSK